MTPLTEFDKTDIRQLLRKADSDLSLAEHLELQPEFFDQLTFHCQQAAEKYAKTRLMALGIAPAKTHDIVRLLDVLSDHESVTITDRQQAEFLTPYAVRMRYLSDEDRNHPPPFSSSPHATSATVCVPPSKPRSANPFAPLSDQSPASQWPSK